jgi:hypothetical protein
MGINRGTVLDLINDVHRAGGFKDYNSYSYLFDQVDTMPESKEDAEPHWIPVTENCDCDLMDNEEVLVFQKDGTINGQIRHAMFYDFNGKKKFVTWEEGITIYNVVAYMPLPEPFKGVTE